MAAFKAREISSQSPSAFLADATGTHGIIKGGRNSPEIMVSIQRCLVIICSAWRICLRDINGACFSVLRGNLFQPNQSFINRNGTLLTRLLFLDPLIIYILYTCSSVTSKVLKGRGQRIHRFARLRYKALRRNSLLANLSNGGF